MIERCEDRQQKLNQLKKSSFFLLAGGSRAATWMAVLLFACGFCERMWTLDLPIAYAFVTFVVPGVGFCLGVVATRSDMGIFQRSTSVAPHSLWKRIRCRIISVAIRSKQALFWTYRMPNWIIHQLCRCQRQQTHLGGEQFPQPQSLLVSATLATLRRTNANTVYCISWILWNITDMQSLDIAIQLAGIILWFIEDGLDAEPHYDLVLSILKACFNSTGKLHPGSRDRAYYSIRAALWIRLRAMCTSIDGAHRFPLPTIHFNPVSLDCDLEDLLNIYTNLNNPNAVSWMYCAHPTVTPLHSQWTSNTLLHLIWAMRSVPDTFSTIHSHALDPTNQDIVPSNTVLNRLLMACIILGQPVEGALMIQDKSCVTP